MPPPRLAPDTNFVLDLANREDFALSAMDAIREHRITLPIVPTVLVELDLLQHGDDATKALPAKKALRLIGERGPFAVSLLSTEEMARGNDAAAALLRAGIIPQSERNDARILAQAAILSIPLVISRDSHISGADPAEIAAIFARHRLPPVHVIRPERIAKRFG